MKLLPLFNLVVVALAVDFEVVNNLPGPVWVGILGNNGKASLASGGFVLGQNTQRVVDSPNDWAGRFWARTWCNPDNNACQTGNCGNRVECNGAGGEPPVSLAEITLRGHGGQDYYDISLVDGYNVKVRMEPVNGQGHCRSIKCDREINDVCPDILKKKGGHNQQQTIACHSSCNKFNTDEYCCRGQYGLPDLCDPNNWEVNSAKIFKENCPDAYSYAYDDKTSTFTCVADKYRIIFG